MSGIRFQRRLRIVDKERGVLSFETETVLQQAWEVRGEGYGGIEWRDVEVVDETDEEQQERIRKAKQ